jgi:hypothetical protein
MKAHKKKISCTASIHVVNTPVHLISGSYEPAVVKSNEIISIHPFDTTTGRENLYPYPSLILNLAAGAMTMNQETNPL